MTVLKRPYALKTSGDSLEVLFYGEIGWEIWASELVDQIKASHATTITVAINSVGGDVYDGLAIMNALAAHPAHVTAVVEGLAASAASLVAVGGADRLVMRPGAQILIHDAWTTSAGPAGDLQKTAAELDRMSDGMAEIYARKAGGSAAEWRERMRSETTYSAAEAVEVGLADAVEDGRVVSQPGLVAPAARQLQRMFARVRARAVEEPSKEIDVDLSEFAERLGVDPSADKDTVLAALDEALAERADDEKVVEDAAETADAAPAVEPGVSDEEEAESNPAAGGDDAASGADNGSEPLTVEIDRALYEELVAEREYAVAARAKAAADERAAVVDEAIKANKISAAARERWVAAMEADPEDTRGRLGRIAPGTIPRAEVGHNHLDEDQTTKKTLPAWFGRARV